jgi:alkylation response protein AidB-like acyl-CoA dehydrogenase
MAWAELSEEHRMLRDLVARFVERELMPLEAAVLAREARGEKLALTPEEEAPLRAKAKELGLWGLDVPEEFGGANLPVLPLMAVEEELGRTLTPFIFPPDSPNLHMMLAVADGRQRERYLRPYAEGEARSAMAISEPGAGGDPAGMNTRAVPDGDGGWRINGRKIWVSNVPAADFLIVMARTGEGKRAEGVTAFIVERGTPGLTVEREIAMIGGRRTYELVFEDCRVPGDQVLGEVGKGYAPMQLRLNVRRLQMGARCVGIARRAL